MRMNFTVFLILFVVIANIIGFGEIFIFKSYRKRGKIYYRWVFPTIFVFYVFILISTFVEYFAIEREINYLFVGLGLGLMVIRCFLKYWSIKSLGENWSIHIETRENQILIKTGPYKYLRHPGYLSTIFDMIVIPIVANAFYTLIWVSVMYLVVLYIRIYTEEKVLIRKFGKEYIEYQKETWAFIPYVY